jgi:predicted SAM-dependent methyltransferase
MIGLSLAARQAAKAVAQHIPPIGRLIRQRDELRREVERLRLQAAYAPSEGPPPQDRRDAVLRHLNLDGLGLEIGPSHNPLVPKSKGYRVEIIDYADADHLRDKYRELRQDISRIEEVDYVSNGGSILDTIGKPGRYDYIVASHVIEHVPDLVGFFRDCEQLLKPDGRLSLAVPDKRYCFDLLQTLSTTGHALEARHARRTDPGTAFDFIANFARRNGRETWGIEDHSEPGFIHGLAQAKQLFDHMHTSNDYVDVHVWRFVPSSFRLIVSDLNALGETSLQELSFAAPGGFEFFTTMSRDAAGCQLDRLTLAKQAFVEHGAIAFS